MSEHLSLLQQFCYSQPQLVSIEGLRQICVNACLQSFQLVCLCNLGREHYHGYMVNLLVGPNLTAHLQSVHLWHHQVRYYHVGYHADSLLQTVVAVDGICHVVVGRQL